MASLYSAWLLALAAGALSWWLVGRYTRAMIVSRRLEAPNERSMHKVPVPVGGGLGIVATMVLLWPLWQRGLSAPDTTLLTCVAGLAALSWVDDRQGLPPAVRLGAQGLAVALCLALAGPEARLVPVIPVAIERLVLGLGWLWFINLFNFMDGIDGLAGSEAVAIAAGYLLLVLAVDTERGPHWSLALIAAAATGGYLAWNWHPAKVFMGDSGSIPLGFLLGWLMLDLAFQGYWAAAAILPAYFAADATWTLVKRILRGERPWKAHREHFYQRAVLGGATPPEVVRLVCIANGILIVLAVASARHPLLSLLAATAVVIALLHRLQALAEKRPS